MHAIDCPRCGDPLTESGEYCAQCDKSIPSSETIDRPVEEKPVAEEIPETPISTAPQPVEEEEEKSIAEEIPETPVSVPQDETLQSPSEMEATSTLLITPENTTDVPADLDETVPMPQGLSRKIRAVAPSADMAETMPIPQGLSREKSAVAPPADLDETVPMPQGLSRKIRAVAPSADMAETVPMPQGLSRETGAVALLVETAETVPMPQGLSREMGADVEFAETIPMPHELSRQARPLAPSAVEFTETVPLSYSTSEGGRTISRSLDVPTLNLRSMRGNARAGLEQDLQESLGEAAQEDVDEETVTLHDNWQKVVEHKNSSVLPAMPVAAPEQKPGKAGWFPVLLGRRSPRSLAWLGVLVAIALLLSGAFGVAVSLGRTAQKVAPSSPTLQALPATIALGGIVTLRGTYFPAGADLTLIRDGRIPLVDTSGASTIRTDAHGFFSDTFVVDPAWHPGTHMLSATDARTHQQASLPLLVTGKEALQGPPHLLLSSASLDLGSDDRFTTTSQQLALSNAGGGQATWQATTSQPWLQITPASGSIESGKHISVVVAADRSQLAPGSYQASIVFISNSGQAMLAVNLEVTDLQPGHQAILRISPAALAFRAAVHGPTPARQTVTISNPGIQPLIWGASVNGSGWLTAAPLGGTIPPGGQQQVTVSATPGALGSGVYQGSLSFFNQGSQPVQGSPQSVSVSLTMTPACTLAFAPASLAFTGAQGELSPAGQALKIGVANGCANQAWKATAATTTGGNWLTVSAAAGTTPSAVTVSAITTGLPAGPYEGTLSFTSGFGTQLLAVTLTVTASTCGVSGAPAVLALQGTANQAQPIAQDVALSATAGCLHALTWTSSASVPWLSATPSGTLTAVTPAAVTITAHLAALPAGSYQGTVTIAVVDSVTKLTVGTVTIAVTLKVDIQSTPIVQPSPTPTATAPPSPTPTATPTPTPTPTATALPSPTATPTSTPTV